MADKLAANAASLKARFQNDFWMKDQNYLALGLDRWGKQLQVVSSNAGHCLWTGILEEEKARAVADRLMSEEMHSGWGIRTLSSQVISYNPLSYHNGSVWPHDNAIIAEGLRKLGRIDDVHRLLNGMLEAAHHQPGYRLPELFCGFKRAAESKPVDYPVSCSPQAWAAGALFQMITACLNPQPDALNHSIRFVEPMLPEWFGKTTIHGLTVGNASVDLSFQNEHNSTICQILRKSGKVKVIIES
jgi:glycogen debranching enzyme